MPIKIPDGLPAAGILSDENIFVMHELLGMEPDPVWQRSMLKK